MFNKAVSQSAGCLANILYFALVTGYHVDHALCISVKYLWQVNTGIALFWIHSVWLDNKVSKGSCTHVRLCVRFRVRLNARFVCKPDRDPIFLRTPITMPCLHSLGKTNQKITCGTPWQQIVHGIVRQIARVYMSDSAYESPFNSVTISCTR
jgi:hypothetical protein